MKSVRADGKANPEKANLRLAVLKLKCTVNYLIIHNCFQADVWKIFVFNCTAKKKAYAVISLI